LVLVVAEPRCHNIVQKLKIIEILDSKDDLMLACYAIMLDKVEDFIDNVLFENRIRLTEDELKYKEYLINIFKDKFRDLLKSLFTYDKLELLRLLDIDNPNPLQLQTVETLQKDLRCLQKIRYEEINDEQIGVFVAKILKVISLNDLLIIKTPELSSQVGRLLVEYSMPESEGLLS
jgi:hypothetical protein